MGPLITADPPLIAPEDPERPGHAPGHEVKVQVYEERLELASVAEAPE